MASLVSTTVNGNLDITEYLRHTGDTNTQIRFESSQITIGTSGGCRMSFNADEKLYFSTGTTPTLALTLDTSQAATFAGVVKIQSTIPTIKLYDTNSDTNSIQVELNGGNFRLYKYTGSTDASHAEIFKLTTAGVVTLAGALTGTSGTFSAGLIATTISGTSGTFSSTVTSVDGLLSNYHQVYNTGTTGFLIATNIVTNNYAFIFGEIRLEQFNVSSHQTIKLSATVLQNGTVYSKEATADIPVTIKLFNYLNKWYIWVPSPSTYTTISAFVNLGAGYQGSTRGSNAITSVTAAAVPASGVTNSMDVVARQRIIANTSGQVFIGSATTTGGKLMVSSSDNTVYDASQASHQRDEGSTLMINNESTTTGSFSQLLLRNRSSNVGGCRIVSIDSGADDSELAIVTGDTNESMRILGDGNVGIGIATPSSLLHVTGTTNDGNTLGQFFQSGTGRGLHVSRTVASATRQLVSFTQLSATGGSTPVVHIQQADTGETALAISTDGSTENFTVSDVGEVYAKGSVGIGTATPDSKLEIAGGNYNSSLKIKSSAAASGIQFEDSAGNTDGYIYANGDSIGILDSGTDWTIQCKNDDYIRFATNGNTEHMRIKSDGKIAIGNNIPMWSGSYGGALVLKGNNSTSDRYAQLGIVDSTGSLVTTGLVVANSGVVGIGTAAPDSLGLNIASASTDPTASYTGNSQLVIGLVGSTTHKLAISRDTDGDNAYIHSYQDGVGGKNLILQPGGGSVGIGTTTPYRNAHIYVAPNSDNFEGALQVGGTTAALGGYFGYNSTISGRLSIISLNNAGGSNAKIYFGFGLDGDGSPTTEVLTLDQNKLVTFGGGMLIPNGSAIVSKNTSGTDVLLLVINSSNELMFGSAAVGLAGHPIRFLSKYIAFEPANGLGVCTETMRVLNGTFAGTVGSVGIGTNAPANLLNVYGGNDITPTSGGAGQFAVTGNGYTTFLAMNATAAYFGHNSSGRSLVFMTDETARLTITGAGAATFVGSVTASTVTASDGGGFTGSGASLTDLNATNLSSGTVNVNRLGSSGTRSSSTFLRGDNTWQTVTSGGGSVTSVAVSVGTGMDVSGSPITSSGDILLSLDLSELTDMTADITTSDEVILLDSGAERRKAFGELKLSKFNNDSGWTSNTGDITAVTAGTALSGGGTSGSVTLNVANPFLLGDNTDTYGIIGRAKVGYIGHGDYAGFAHRDVGTTTSYALIQDSVGSTFLNAANNKLISFRINNANVIAMDSTSLYSVTNNAEALGKTGNRWSNVYSVLGNFSGDITVGGNWNGLDWEDLPNISTLGALPA